LKQLPDPDQPGAELTVLLGELLCQAGQYQEAEAALAKAGASPARDYRLRYYLGLCQLQAGAPQMAQHSFIKAVQQLNPHIVALPLAEMSRISQEHSCNTSMCLLPLATIVPLEILTKPPHPPHPSTVSGNVEKKKAVQHG